MTATGNSSLLLHPPANKHILLVYDDRKALDSAIASYLNVGLENGQLCVYATIHFRDQDYIEGFSSLISNYKEHIKNGNLLFLDLAKHYISAVMGDLTPFEEAKKSLEEKASQRANKSIRFVGDGTGFLFKNRHFDECAVVEEWWQQKPFEGTYVCPFSSSSFDGYLHEVHCNRAVMATHDIVINISEKPLSSEMHKHQMTDVVENQEQTGKGQKFDGGVNYR